MPNRNALVPTLLVAALLSGCAGSSTKDTTPPGPGAPSSRSRPSSETSSPRSTGKGSEDPPRNAAPDPGPPGAPEARSAILRRAFQIQGLLNEAERALESGETEAALALVEEALAMDPSEPRGNALEARLLREAGRFDEAVETARAARGEHPHDFYLLREEALGLEAKGDLESAIEALDTRKVRPGYRPRLHRLRAGLHARLGNVDAALEDLRRAVTRGFVADEELASDPRFETLRNDPRFRDVLELAETKRKRVEALNEQALATGPEYVRSLPSKELLRELRFRIKRGDSHYLDLEATTLAGDTFRSRDHAGKKLVVFAWAHWSARSRDMLPRLVRLRERYGDRGLEVLLAAVDVYDRNEEFEAETRKALEADRIELPSVVLDGRDALRALSTLKVPVTYFVATEGRRYLRADGPLDEETLHALVEVLLEETDEESATDS